MGHSCGDWVRGRVRDDVWEGGDTLWVVEVEGAVVGVVVDIGVSVGGRVCVLVIGIDNVDVIARVEVLGADADTDTDAVSARDWEIVERAVCVDVVVATDIDPDVVSARDWVVVAGSVWVAVVVANVVEVDNVIREDKEVVTSWEWVIGTDADSVAVYTEWVTVAVAGIVHFAPRHTDLQIHPQPAVPLVPWFQYPLMVRVPVTLQAITALSSVKLQRLLSQA